MLHLRSKTRFASLLFVLVPMAELTAQPAADPDWPCVQVLVPEISAGIVWPRPIDEALRGEWQDDPDTRVLAQDLGELESFTDTERERIERFVEAKPAGERLTRLNRLADGILEVANRRRDSYIRGIKRYTRQQISAAEKIEAGLNTLSRDEDGFESAAARQEFEETLRWQERIYDQRESAIISLCERPVELEQTLSTVLREVAQYLP